MKNKGTVVIIAVVILAIGIIVGTYIAKLSEDKDTVISATPVVNENESSTPTSGNRSSSKYNSGDIVDIAKAKLAHSVVAVTDRFMDADGHSYEIFNQPDDTVSSIVIHLNKQFSTLKYSVFNKAILTGSGSEGASIISESTKDGEPIGNPILSEVVPADEIYPTDIEVDVTGLDYVVVVDQKQNLQTYNFIAIAK
ncbi:hypothetical protein IJ21_35500 [Paenibacillus sp. 32O-W]|uniref:Uncharacterized protein n=1 Tax=Paenibacillus cisolokensis TaxID=1658519 RepID=A0ABQ4N326_9BACL|nr:MULTISPECIES: hypothetical protein [Paenibacillus]ALS28938.1 hypothetical protein IJ21_35500 [Paenibacillus sp. 32O-W]GIQ62618.1 hypothetical protein PACILC2_11860 [Paenibacillus cisolokensis]